MNFDLIYISPISGAVIGYFTNWLAIKMLFRPHEPKYIFGMKLPFTPGLIPKERARLSVGLCNAIENHLLTEDALVKRFTSPETIDGIGAALDGFIAKLRTDDRKVNEAVVNLFDKNDSVNDESISWFINEKIIMPLAAQNNFTNKFLSETRTPRELLPDETVISIKKAAGELLPRVGELLTRFISESTENDAKLRELTHKVINENINGFISAFINKDRAYENIKEGLLSYFTSPESLAEHTIKLWAQTDKLLDTPVCELILKLPEDIKNEIGKLENFGSGPAINILQKILDIKISAAADKIAAGYESARPAVTKFIAFVVRHGASFAASRLELGKIAEEQMNSMDVAQAEKIILGVCGRELKAITRLGGILGFIIGLTPILLNLLGR